MFAVRTSRAARKAPTGESDRLASTRPRCTIFFTGQTSWLGLTLAGNLDHNRTGRTLPATVPFVHGVCHAILELRNMEPRLTLCRETVVRRCESGTAERRVAISGWTPMCRFTESIVKTRRPSNAREKPSHLPGCSSASGCMDKDHNAPISADGERKSSTMHGSSSIMVRHDLTPQDRTSSKKSDPGAVGMQVLCDQQ